VATTTFHSNARTHEWLTDIKVKDLSLPNDIAVCDQTHHVLTVRKASVIRWRRHKALTDKVTVEIAIGDELSRINLPHDMKPCHAVESPTKNIHRHTLQPPHNRSCVRSVKSTLEVSCCYKCPKTRHMAFKSLFQLRTENPLKVIMSKIPHSVHQCSRRCMLQSNKT